MRSVGIVGFGQMGSALGRGLQSRQPQRLWGAYDKLPTGIARVEELGGKPFETLEALCAESDIVFLAVKPQDIRPVCEVLRPLVRDRLVVSVAAGIKLERLGAWLDTRRIARWMPNLAASVGSCLVGMAFAEGLSEDDARENLLLAEALGGGVVVSEKLLNAVTGISGSGLAFGLSFLHGLALGGVHEGLTYAQALDFAVEVAVGAAKLVKEWKQHPETIVSQVCSPAGTTIEGLLALQRGGFLGLVAEAVIASSHRAAELEG